MFSFNHKVSRWQNGSSKCLYSRYKTIHRKDLNSSTASKSRGNIELDKTARLIISYLSKLNICREWYFTYLFWTTAENKTLLVNFEHLQRMIFFLAKLNNCREVCFWLTQFGTRCFIWNWLRGLLFGIDSHQLYWNRSEPKKIKNIQKNFTFLNF